MLTRVSPPDHPWMRGLWFTIKYVDGINFWEEDPHHERGFGTQRYSGLDCVSWIAPDGRKVLDEQRTLGHVDLSPTAYAIDWTTTLRSATGRDVVLDRTPYTTWGGYGGLTIRGAADWTDTRIVLADGSEHRRPEGVPARWATLENDECGTTFLDHPDNPRHPVPWYGATRSPVYGEGWSNYLNAAFLFHEPLTLAGHDRLRFRYRVVVHEGPWRTTDADGAWEAFASS